MDKISELCVAEQKYINKLQLVAGVYRDLVYEAADPEVQTVNSRIDLYPGLLSKYKEIFRFFEEMLEVHTDLFEFWTYSPEEYLNAEHFGRLFYHALIEKRFDVYLRHVVSNPLLNKSMQEDLTGFIVSGCREWTCLGGLFEKCVLTVLCFIFRKTL